MNRTRTLLVLAALAGLMQAAQATNHPPQPQKAADGPSASSTASAGAGAGAWASGGQAAGGSAGSSSAFTDSSRGGGFYVLPTAGAAAPLPATLCPKGDSSAWGIGWNFFWTSTTSTRTELECLERVLAIVKASQPVVVEQRLPPISPGQPLHPPVAAKKKPACPKGTKAVAECRKV